MLKAGDKVIVKIEKLVFGGQGIGRIEAGENGELRIGNRECGIEDGEKENLENLKIFVENTVPEDIVEVKIIKKKKNYVDAKLEKIIQPSPLRIEAKCKHFGSCGGCGWQFLSYENQLKSKQSQVVEILERIGGFQNSKDLVAEIIGCSDQWFYRNKMEFSFGDTELREFALGLHKIGRQYDLENITECLLESDLANKILNSVFAWAQKYHLNFYKFRENAGILRNLVIREGKNTNQVMVNLITSHETLDRILVEKFVEMLRAIDQKICSIYLTKVITKKGERTRSVEKLLWGKEEIEEELNIRTQNSELRTQSFRFKISPKSFFQPNTKQAEVLYSKVLEFADLKGLEIVYDLYCGTGTIGMILSKFAKKVYGIELIEDAVEDGKKNAALNNCENIEFLCGDAAQLIPEIHEKPDLIIVDPPRAGLSEESLQNILNAFQGNVETIHESSLQVHDDRFRKLIYVSCNPTTLARDLKIFCENGFELQKNQPVDMFPHTYHIENIALLIKK